MRVLRKFYFSIAFLRRYVRKASDWRWLVVNVVKFFKGGVQYKDAAKMPLSELIQLEGMARDFNTKVAAEIERKKNAS